MKSPLPSVSTGAVKDADEAHFFNASLDMLCIVSPAGKFLKVNPEWEACLGYPAAELEGQDFLQFVHPEDMDATLEVLDSSSGKTRVVNFENRYRRRDGAYRWIEWRSIPSDGRIYASARDVTERKKVERELRSMHDQFQSLVHNIPGITYRCRLDEQWTMLYMSDAVEELTGYPPEDFVNNRVRSYDSLILPEDSGYVARSVVEAAHEGRSWNIEYRIRHRDGTVLWVHEKGNYITGADQAEAFLDGFILDITERVEARHRLTSIYEALSEGVLLIDTRGQIRECNPAAELVLGLSHDQIVGRTPRDPRWRPIREDGSDLPADEMPAMRTLKTGEPVRGFVHGIVHPDGQTRWLSIGAEPVREHDGSLRGVVATMSDITAAYEQQYELATQKRILEAVLDSPSTGFWDWKLSEGVEHYSPSWLRMLGYRPGELPETPDTWQQLIYPEDLPTVMAQYTAHIETRGQQPYYNKARYRHRDGSTVWVLCIGRVVEWSADGEPRRMAGCHIDITAGQEAELQIEGQKRELQAVLDAIPGFVFYKDEQNRILDLNKAAADSIGLPKAQIRNRTAETFFAAEDAATGHEDDRAVIESGRPRLGIIESSKTTGVGLRHIRTDKIPLRGPSGGFDRLVAITTDITEIVESRERSHRNQQRLNMALQASNTGLWEWDIQTGDTLFSDTWYTMLGYAPGELPMRIATWQDLCHPDDRDRASQTLDRHFRAETDVYDIDHRLRRKDGSWSWVRGVGEVIERADDGTPLKVVGVNIDIQQLRESVIRAKAASQAKSEFLANMSHEIRTPMTAILGYAELLETGMNEDPQQTADAIKTIQSNARHLLTIINDILDMSKIEAGQMTVEAIETDPVQIVEEVASLMRPAAVAKNIDLRVIYDSPVPLVIRSDPTRLRQILLNLAGNAIKFTETGSVTIRAACDPSGERLSFRVVDTGIGMTKAQRAAIAGFEAFSQADSSTTRRFGGTGLGLRISNSLAAMLGGGIEVASAAGKGSSFTVTIGTGALDGMALHTPAQAIDLDHLAAAPQPAAGTSQPANAEPARPAPLKGLRILLAEDGPDNRRLISFLLKKAGATITVADNGLIAAQTIESATPDTLPHVVLMDMQMPELDGYGATRRLRQGGCSLPIIALTAHAMEGDRQKCLNAGCDDYLTKPIDKTRLIETCEDWARKNAATTVE